jgi:hypothetical protein
LKKKKTIYPCPFYPPLAAGVPSPYPPAKQYQAALAKEQIKTI